MHHRHLFPNREKPDTASHATPPVEYFAFLSSSLFYHHFHCGIAPIAVGRLGVNAAIGLFAGELEIWLGHAERVGNTGRPTDQYWNQQCEGFSDQREWLTIQHARSEPSPEPSCRAERRAEGGFLSERSGLDWWKSHVYQHGVEPQP